ncbi:MAG TPA: protein phosphatase 2C domain-containing protein [Gemmatimonadaceae bacterium]|nr:protein phosphatase 2C domain-containing protein [Gemmatimonadaceae bacterium]
MPAVQTILATSAEHAGIKPKPTEVDAFGLTHPGRVRQKNADHFLVASFHRAMQIHASSVARDIGAFSEDSRGYLALVTDGVGALTQAAEGSEQAIKSIARHLLDMGEVSLQTSPERADEVAERLRSGMLDAHRSLLALSEITGGSGTAATTMTMIFGVWPRLFVLHAGDSRFYRLRDSRLERFTVDQTMAQMMIDSGAMSRETAEASRLRNVLVSALGSSELDPQIEVLDIRRGDTYLLCTDGLTRHVCDEEIEAQLLAGSGAESTCRLLVDRALERGGVDNVTVVIVHVPD